MTKIGWGGALSIARRVFHALAGDSLIVLSEDMGG
jgi:hypothetical protein